MKLMSYRNPAIANSNCICGLHRLGGSNIRPIAC
jgi:hypothetical protein